MSISRSAAILSLLLCACGTGNGDLQGDEAGNAVVPPADQSGTGPGTGDSEGAPVQGVELAAPAEAKPGSGVNLELRNGSASEIGYNLCTSTLKSAAGREMPTSQVCTMELRTLKPEATATYRFPLPVNMLEGSYRFATQVHWMDEGRMATVRSNAFEVQSD
jgi:hypothetical protein